jgi:aspartate 1-decarboxylase
MEAAKLRDYEAIQVWNVTRGTRLETYAITGNPADDNIICANGAAAHLMKPQDIIIIAAFLFIEDTELEGYEATIVITDQDNRIKSVGHEVPGPHKRD